jgi:hypothetical protein
MADDMAGLRWLKTISTPDNCRLSRSQSTPTTSLWASLHRLMDHTFGPLRFGELLMDEGNTSPSGSSAHGQEVNREGRGLMDRAYSEQNPEEDNVYPPQVKPRKGF